MSGKIIPWLLLIIAVLVTVIVVLASRDRPEPEIRVTTEIDTLYIRNIVRTTIDRERVITEYDTVYVDGRPYEVARYNATIDTTKVKVKLDIAYWELYRKFDVKAEVEADVDTVYITKTTVIKKTIEKPYKAIAFMSGISTGFKLEDSSPKLNDVSLDLGVRLRGKYDIGLFGGTDERVGVRFGVAY